MNIQEILTKAVIQSKEVERMLVDAANQEIPAPPVVDPIQAEEDEWLEPLRLGGTIILRDSL